MMDGGCNVHVKIAGKTVAWVSRDIDCKCVGDVVSSLSYRDCYVLHQGKIANFNQRLCHGEVYTICPRLRGGKGGFGSMLRAIGAQIEKTTNREACRDLSGRRMRDVNNEKKMVEYLEKKAEEERDRIKKKKEKLKRLTHKPKHFFNDPEYDTKVHETVESVDKAVEQGILAHTRKRKLNEKTKVEPEIKKGLWLEEDDISSDDSHSDSDAEILTCQSNKSTLSHDGASTSKSIGTESTQLKDEENSNSKNDDTQPSTSDKDSLNEVTNHESVPVE